MAHRHVPTSRVTASAERDALGGQDFIYSQRSGVSEGLFKGDLLGVDADVATGDLRNVAGESRKLKHLKGNYHVPERFKQKVAAHVAKNCLVEDDTDPSSSKSKSGLRSSGVPLILGIWGAKGCGKSFNVELCCRDMGIMPFMVSAGELEDPVAGEPGALLRRRYLAAARFASRKGTPTVVIINDLDAGVGRFQNDSVTVNNQIVQASLMHLCDTPCEVRLSTTTNRREWDSREERNPNDVANQNDETSESNQIIKCRRVPMIATGNDFSRVYAPLTRAGRMDLWHWEPSRDEITEMVHNTLDDSEKINGYGYNGKKDAEVLVSQFPDQPLDFFTAVRSHCVDDAVRLWLKSTSPEQVRQALVGSESVNDERDADSVFSKIEKNLNLPRQDISLPSLLKAAHEIATEQQNVLDQNLAREYVNNWGDELVADVIREERLKRSANARAPEARNILQEYEKQLREKELVKAADREAEALRKTVDMAKQAREAMRTESAVALERGETTAIEIGIRSEDAITEELQSSQKMEESSLPWAVWDCVECYRARQESPNSTIFIDIRPRKQFDRETVKGAVNCPAAVVGGTIVDLVITPDIDGAVTALTSKNILSTYDTIIIIGNGEGEGSFTRNALLAIWECVDSNSTALVEMRGGIGGWLHRYTPGGKPRPRYVGYGKDNEETMFTASN